MSWHTCLCFALLCTWTNILKGSPLRFGLGGSPFPDDWLSQGVFQIEWVTTPATVTPFLTDTVAGEPTWQAKQGSFLMVSNLSSMCHTAQLPVSREGGYDHLELDIRLGTVPGSSLGNDVSASASPTTVTVSSQGKFINEMRMLSHQLQSATLSASIPQTFGDTLNRNITVCIAIPSQTTALYIDSINATLTTSTSVMPTSRLPGTLTSTLLTTPSTFSAYVTPSGGSHDNSEKGERIAWVLAVTGWLTTFLLLTFGGVAFCMIYSRHGGVPQATVPPTIQAPPSLQSLRSIDSKTLRDIDNLRAETSSFDSSLGHVREAIPSQPIANLEIQARLSHDIQRTRKGSVAMGPPPVHLPSHSAEGRWSQSSVFSTTSRDVATAQRTSYVVPFVPQEQFNFRPMSRTPTRRWHQPTLRSPRALSEHSAMSYQPPRQEHPLSKEVEDGFLLEQSIAVDASSDLLAHHHHQLNQQRLQLVSELGEEGESSD
eukprot:m.91301 g.91301  ORF g.91301 m.91301 type:complete len:486 (+) comp12941_c0_seq9:325-1782(+)